MDSDVVLTPQIPVPIAADESAAVSITYRADLDPVGDFCMARLKLSGGSAIHGVNWAAVHRRPRLIQLESEVAPI